MAGVNHTGKIIRQYNLPYSDDEIGGSVPSGTIIKDPVFCRIEQMPATQVLLEQGLEVPDMYKAFAFYTGDPLDIRTNDQLEIYAPQISPFFTKIFRVVGYRHSSQQDDRRKFVELTLRRHEISRTEGLQ